VSAALPRVDFGQFAAERFGQSAGQACFADTDRTLNDNKTGVLHACFLPLDNRLRRRIQTHQASPWTRAQRLRHAAPTGDFQLAVEFGKRV
jgi:hypothetical protein